MGKTDGPDQTFLRVVRFHPYYLRLLLLVLMCLRLRMILLLKTGKLDAGYFRNKFGVEILNEWRDTWQQYADDELLTISGDEIRVTRSGLLQVDALLPAFFESQYRDVRYT